MPLNETPPSDDDPSKGARSEGHIGPLRIAYIFMRYPLAPQPFAISDVQALEALGHRVDVYALSGRDKAHETMARAFKLNLGPRSHMSAATLAALVTPANWPILLSLLTFLFRHHGNRIGPLVKALLLVPRLVEVVAELRRDPPDVVHAFWGHYPSLVLPLVAKFAPACHRSMFLGAYDLTSHLIPYSRYTSGLCDTVWTHSEENRAALIDLKIDPQKFGVVHRGIPLDLCEGPQPRKEQFRICTAANLQKEKNIDRILEVFKRVRAHIPEAQLVIAGDGVERQALERMAVDLGVDDSVTFTGHLKRDLLFREMAQSRIFLFLSTKVSERLPNVVKEAMLAECHCIVSETPGIRELIAPGETGDIVDAADLDDVADRIVGAMRHGSVEVGPAAAGFVRRNMSAEAAMRRYVDGWCEATAAAGSGNQRTF